MEPSHFEKVLKKIGDSYEVSIRRLGSFGEKIDVIPSGSYVLDELLGVGGFPRGRLIEIYGEFSSGKCVSSDSYVFSEDGLLTLKELSPNLFNGELKSFIKKILTSKGVRKSSYIYNDGIKKVVKITTSCGFVLKGSFENTKVLVLNENGLEWKPISKIEIEDFVILVKGKEIFGNTSLKIFKTKNYQKKLNQIYQWGKTFNELSFPIEVRKAPKEEVIYFLGGLFENRVQIYEHSLFIHLPLEWCKIVHLFLLNLGVIGFKKDLLPLQKHSLLFITGNNLKRFKEIFSFTEFSKHIVLNNEYEIEEIPFSKEIVNSFFDSIGEKEKVNRNLTKFELKKIVNKYKSYFSNLKLHAIKLLSDPNIFVDNVIKIEEESCEVYDIEVPLVHDFVANGIITHNTLLGLLGIASVQQQNGKALFVDAEYTLDLKWAKILGVNVNDLYVLQENCFEKVMNVLEKVIEESLFDIIIVDSVTALVPQKELEGEIEDQQIALQARLMSQTLRKLVGKISRSKTVVIFINQLRDNVGTMFGNPTTTPGGKALKFYSTIRIHVSKEAGSDVKKDGIKIGHRVKFKIEKNKVAPPFKEGSTLLIYQKGIDKVRELLEIALRKGIIDLKGNTYVWKDKKWVGFENMLEFFNANLESLEEIKNNIFHNDSTNNS